MGGSEIILILLAVLVLFGADKLPEFAKGLGKGLREVKKATDEIKNELTNGSSNIMNELKEISHTITQNGNDLVSHTNEITNEITQTINTEIPDVYNDTQNDIDSLPYHEQIKRNFEKENT